MKADGVSQDLGQWALRTVQEARRYLQQAQLRKAEPWEYNEASARLACVLEELPDLWQELCEELMQSIWLGSDAEIQSHLAEDAAGSLLAESGRMPRNLAELFCLVGRALARESRYCAAFALLRKAHHIAGPLGSRDMTLATLIELRSLALPTWHFHMLNDTPRNCAFAAAIEDALIRLCSRNAPRHLSCLDIGTGTGLLALVCWQLGREMPLEATLDIHACEENEILFAMASDIIDGRISPRAEDLSFVSTCQVPNDKVQLHRTNSRHLHIAPVDLVFCEAVDAELVGEGFLRTALDACERLLKPNGILIPCRATLLGQLVYCPSLSKRFAGYSFRTAAMLREEFLSDYLENLEHTVLSEATELLHIAFDNPKELRRQMALDTFIELHAVRGGTAHALVVWWDLFLDKFGQHTISSHPGRPENHWPQVFWPLWKANQDPPQLGKYLTASDSLTVRIQIFEDRLHCKQEDFLEPKSVVRASEQDLQWLNDTVVWECLRCQYQAATPHRDICILDGSALRFPVPLLVAASTLEEPSPSAYLAAVDADRELVEAFLKDNHLCEEVVLAPGSFADVVDRALSSERFCKASFILVVADVVARSGQIRAEALAKVCAAHRSCKALGRGLTVLPKHLELKLMVIESPALARRSRVLRPLKLRSGATVDVGRLNSLKPDTFDSLFQETLAVKALAPSQAVLQLSLSSPSFEDDLRAINGQKFRLGPATCAGHVDGIVCEWSWCLQHGTQEFPHFAKAGALWPQKDSLSDVRVGDFIIVEVHVDVEQRVFIVPLRIHQDVLHLSCKANHPRPAALPAWRSIIRNKWLAWQRRRASRPAGRVQTQETGC